MLAEQHASHFDLQDLSDAETDALRALLQALGNGATSRQMVAERLVVELFASLRIASNDEPACALVRCFQTATYARMPTAYQAAADVLLESVASRPNSLEQMRCLSLLATCGVRQVWNDVLTSVGHQAIPLPSVEVVRKAPMIARLLDQLGMPVERAVVSPDSPELQVRRASADFSVFYIEQAAGSAFIPAQTTFVRPHGVRSVLGIGGVLPDGELIAIVMFTRVPVSKEVAKRFGGLAADMRQLFLPFPPARTFRHDDD